MDNKGLLFIPDISGFTRFVHQTDIEHSRMIIQELLEVLIEANDIGLHVSEIEGDAILFYKFGDNPELEELYNQVQKMFCEFHKRLNAYEDNRFCQCNACVSAIGLSLKVITHYCEFTGYTIKNFNKLIGKDVIVAHQLLKNDIDKHEYWLVTDSLVQNDSPRDFAQWMKWDKSVKQTETGDVAFHYTQLAELKNNIEPDPPPTLELEDKKKRLSVSKVYETDIIRLFHASGDFQYRNRWQDGVKAVEEISHYLPRLGMRYRQIKDEGSVVIYASSYKFTPERIEFGETEENKKNATHYIIEDLGQGKLKLTLDYYDPRIAGGQISFNLFRKKKLEASLTRSLNNLAEAIKTVKLPGEA